MSEGSVEQELLTATGQKPRGKKENVPSYFARVATAVSDLEDSAYDALSEATKDWFTQAAAALSEDPPAPEKIEAFPEVEAEATEENVEEAANEVEEEAPPEKPKPTAKVGKKEAVAAPPKGKAAEKAKAENKTSAPASRGGSVADTIRYAMCENPEATKDDVAKVLKTKKLSFDQSRLDQVYSATARVLVILAELKKLK